MTNGGIAGHCRPISAPVWTLALALVLASLFGLHGIDWGRWETWHPDQMAFRDLGYGGRPMNPDQFVRPPLYSYVVWFALLPLRAWDFFAQPDASALAMARLLTARLVTVLCFLLAIGSLFRVVRRIFGAVPAAIVSLLFATTAGVVAFAHFPTADIALTCAMLLAFDAAQRVLERDVVRDSIVAGLAVGLAAATKYNGLAVGIALPLAHVLRADGRSLAQKLRLKGLWMGLAMIPVGFVAGNPYAVLDARRFLEDFLYNLAVTPRFEGQTGGVSYGAFLINGVEILGWPQSVLMAVSLAGLVFARVRGRLAAPQRRHLCLLSAVLVLYFFVIGGFPRLPVRFVLPVLPLLAVFSGWSWGHLSARRSWCLGLLAPLLAYNLVCSWMVGERFRADPRHAAQDWLAAHLPAGVSVEYTAYAPRPDVVPGVRARAAPMPWISGRRPLFEQMLADRPFLRPALDRLEPPADAAWYTPAALAGRAPDFVVLDSLFYDRFAKPPGRAAYPEVAGFFDWVMRDGSPYRAVFDAGTAAPPSWAYPRTIDFLANRVTILRRKH